MSRYYLYLLMLIVFLFVMFAASGHSEDKSGALSNKSNVQVLMRDKLDHMNRVLEGLVLDDFEKVAAEAETLGMIGKAASWQTIDTKQYRTLSNRYAALTATLKKAAHQENRDSVLLQYLQLNISCVDCHQYMKDLK